MKTYESNLVIVAQKLSLRIGLPCINESKHLTSYLSQTTQLHCMGLHAYTQAHRHIVPNKRDTLSFSL